MYIMYCVYLINLQAYIMYCVYLTNLQAGHWTTWADIWACKQANDLGWAFGGKNTVDPQCQKRHRFFPVLNKLIMRDHSKFQDLKKTYYKTF